MRFFYDCEFIEDGSTIQLISIGILSEDGREYYAVNSEMPMKRISEHDWLCRNVVPSLPVTNPQRVRDQLDKRKFFCDIDSSTRLDFTLDTTNTCVKPLFVIANEVRDFLLSHEKPQLWAYCGAYDHVTLMWLWGPMARKPAGLPFYTRDLQQRIDETEERLGRAIELPEQAEGHHNALADARYVRDVMATLEVM